MKRSRILLAVCMFVPIAAHAETPKDRTVAAIEEAGCVLEASNMNEVLDGLGLSDDDTPEGEASGYRRIQNYDQATGYP